jgi:hypothetical protein
MTLDTLNLALRTLLTFVLISWSSIALSASETPRASFYISPAGSDSNSGRRAGEPFRTFEHAFRKLLAGDELILLDGVYSESAGTGHIGYVESDPGRVGHQPAAGSWRSGDEPISKHASPC